MFQELLNQARRRLRRRQRLARIGWPLPRPPAGNVLQQQECRKLIRRGRVVWGAVAQANAALYDPGEMDLPGNIVFSPSAYFDGRPRHLTSIANRLYRLKADLDEIGELPLQAVALTIRDEFNLVENMLLPESLTDGHEVYFSQLQFVREYLPGGSLAEMLLPVLILPRDTPVQMLLPGTLWPPALRQGFLDGLRLGTLQERREEGRVGEEPAYPHQRTWQAIVDDQNSRGQPPEEGVELTSTAARVLLDVLKEKSPDALAKIELTPEGHAFSLVTDWDPETEICVESRGVRLLVEKSQWERVSGTLIDYKQSSQEHGFTFLTRD